MYNHIKRRAVYGVVWYKAFVLDLTKVLLIPTADVIDLCNEAKHLKS